MVWKLAKGYSMNAVKVSLVTIHVYHSGKHSWVNTEKAGRYTTSKLQGYEYCTTTSKLQGDEYCTTYVTATRWWILYNQPRQDMSSQVLGLCFSLLPVYTKAMAWQSWAVAKKKKKKKKKDCTTRWDRIWAGTFSDYLISSSVHKGHGLTVLSYSRPHPAFCCLQYTQRPWPDSVERVNRSKHAMLMFSSEARFIIAKKKNQQQQKKEQNMARSLQCKGFRTAAVCSNRKEKLVHFITWITLTSPS